MNSDAFIYIGFITRLGFVINFYLTRAWLTGSVDKRNVKMSKQLWLQARFFYFPFHVGSPSPSIFPPAFFLSLFPFLKSCLAGWLYLPFSFAIRTVIPFCLWGVIQGKSIPCRDKILFMKNTSLSVKRSALLYWFIPVRPKIYIDNWVERVWTNVNIPGIHRESMCPCIWVRVCQNHRVGNGFEEQIGDA